jgi:tetratricopeptide (TPR) repeat protein
MTALLTRLWLSSLASVALLIGAKARALEFYREIVQVDPRDIDARATLGNMLADRGEHAAAIEQFTQLVQAHPEHVDSWFNLGYLYEQRELVTDAERCFRRATALNDMHDRAWYGLALVLIRLDRLAEAIPALKRNIALQPFSPYGYYQLAMTHHHLGAAGDAWRLHEQLKGFEPRYAATLKREMENTAPRAPAAAAPVHNDNVIEKEVIRAGT